MKPGEPQFWVWDRPEADGEFKGHHTKVGGSETKRRYAPQSDPGVNPVDLVHCESSRPEPAARRVRGALDNGALTQGSPIRVPTAQGCPHT